MTNPTEQPREWYIYFIDGLLDALYCEREFDSLPEVDEGDEELVRVIEYSAYEALQAQLNELKKLNEYYQDFYLKPVREKVHADLADSSEECDSLSAKLSALEAKHDELLSYLPKVPSEPYERGLARKLAIAEEALEEMKDKVRLREFANQKLEFEHVRLVGIIRKNELNKRKVLEAELAELRESK